MYAWHDFRRDEVIATYTGSSLGVYDDWDEASIETAVARLPEGRNDKVLELVKGDGTVEQIVDWEILPI